MHYVVNVHTGDVISTWDITTNKTHILTINDKPAGGGETLDELKEKYPDDAQYMKVCDEALMNILWKEGTYRKYNVGKWTETTEDEYWDMLEVLPPQKWSSLKDRGVDSIFRMSEYTTGPITRHYMKKGDTYWTGNFDVTSYDTYEDIII